jgi:hypothetical protein
MYQDITTTSLAASRLIRFVLLFPASRLISITAAPLVLWAPSIPFSMH